MAERQGDFGSALPGVDKRRGRFVTPRNNVAPYTQEQRREALNTWWDTHMIETFPRLAQDLIAARGAAIAAGAGANVVVEGTEMEVVEVLSTVREALAKIRGLAVTSEELVDRVVREARALEASSGNRHLAVHLSGVVVNAFADVRHLRQDTRHALIQRTRQRRLPNF